MYRSRTAPYAHQAEALRRSRERPASRASGDVFALLMEMGTGKSKVLIDDWGSQADAGELDDLLIIAPAGCYLNWCEDKGDLQVSELRRHMDPGLLDRCVVHAWRSGAGTRNKEKLRALLECSDRPRVLVINVEALSSVQRARDAAAAFLQRRAMVAVDESTTIKNERAARSRVVVNLGSMARARRILTGLPTPQSPLDLFGQFMFLDWRILGHNEFWTFKRRYAVTANPVIGRRYNAFTGQDEDILSQYKHVVGYRNEEELRQKIAPHSFRVLKQDCLDLPPKVYELRSVGLTREQERIYRELREYATAELESGDHVTATLVIVKMLRLHQVLCGHVKDEEGRVHDVPEERSAAVLEVLQEVGGKAIIWVAYEHSLRLVARRIAEEFGEGSVATFWGGNKNQRGEEERRWLGDPACRFMVSTYAGGLGNTWLPGTTHIYHSNSHNLLLRMQSEDRSHRSGQTNRVTYVDLVAEGTVDEKIISALRRKIDLASAITGDGWREWVV